MYEALVLDDIMSHLPYLSIAMYIYSMCIDIYTDTSVRFMLILSIYTVLSPKILQRKG